jgi:hypothetical protein
LVETVKEKIAEGSSSGGSSSSHGVIIEQEKSFWDRYGKFVAIAVVLLVVVGGFLAYNGMNSQSSEDVNQTGIDIGYIGLQDNGGTYSYNVYGAILNGSNASSSDVIHIDFYDKNGKEIDSSDTKVGEASGNILGSIDSSNKDISKVSVELQNSNKKVLYSAESDNVVSE